MNEANATFEVQTKLGRVEIRFRLPSFKKAGKQDEFLIHGGWSERWTRWYELDVKAGAKHETCD